MEGHRGRRRCRLDFVAHKAVSGNSSSDEEGQTFHPIWRRREELATFSIWIFSWGAHGSFFLSCSDRFPVSSHRNSSGVSGSTLTGAGAHSLQHVPGSSPTSTYPYLWSVSIWPDLGSSGHGGTGHFQSRHKGLRNRPHSLWFPAASLN